MIWKPSPRTPLTADRRSADRRRRRPRPTAARASSTSASAAPTTSASGCCDDRRLPLDLGDRQLPDGPARRRGRGPPAGPHAPRAGRQQRDHHHALAPTSSWPSGRPSSPPSAPPASGARRVRRLIVHESIHDQVLERLSRVYRRDPDRRPLGRVGPDGTADQRAGRRDDDGGPRGGAATGRRGRPRRQAPRPAGLLRRAGARQGTPRHADRRRGDVRADPVRHELPDARRGDRDPERGRAGADLGDLHRTTCARPSSSSRPRAPTAGSPT